MRTLVLAARPLEASDIQLQNEGKKTQNASAEIRTDRITASRLIYDGALTGLQNDFIAIFDPLIDAEDVDVGISNLAAIVSAIDARSALFVEHMSTLGAFGMAGAGAGFVPERRRNVHTAYRNRVLAYLTRWADFEVRYQTLISTDLPAATTMKNESRSCRRPNS